MMSGKCISHFKMLSSVSRTYYGEVAMSSPIFYFIFLLLLFYVLKGNSRVILSLLLGFTPVWASCSMSYQAIIISYFCWTTVWTSVCRCPIPYWVIFPCSRRRWLFERIIFACPYSKFDDPSIWGNWNKCVSQAAEADLLALFFLLEGSSVGGLVVGRRLLLAVLFIAWLSNGFCWRRGSLGLAPLAMKWFTSIGSEAGLGGLPTGKGEGGGPSTRFDGLEAPLVFRRISPKRLLK